MRFLAVFLITFGLVACAEQQGGSVSGSVDGVMISSDHRAGFFDLYVDEEKGAIYALLPAPDEEGTSLRFIHAMRMTAGLGSNPIGLDRGWGNSGQIIRFRHVAGKVIAEVESHRYRASADNALEKQAVAQSFARSFIWSTPVVETAADGALLIDISSFLLKDTLGIAQKISSDGSSMGLDSSLSMPVTNSALAFPDNVELEADLTFSTSSPGPEVQATAPYPNSVTVRVHHSFVRLPDDGYKMRKADPRVGTFTLGFYDYSAPLEGQVLQTYAMRHRLEHKEPGNSESAVVEPLVFYVDPGAPQQIRDALVDGASWWGDAFEAAGFKGGYRIEVLPEGAHPLDIRYNVIQWVHRQTRGWSYGGGIIDPRTGEFIKGHVILGSQRVRQDRMIFEGLAGVAKTGTGADDDPVELSLDRIRQLSAHEVGHALGFGHNFAASVNGRASVEDYPAPYVIANEDGTLDFSQTYDAGIGDWDIATTKWLYGEFAPEEEQAKLNEIVADAREAGLLFIADGHGRSKGTAHPAAAVWDNANDPIAELNNVMNVRRIALANFDEMRIAEGRPMAALKEVITPIYLYHRYQINAAAKSLGGASYQYGKRGQDAADIEIVPANDQRRSLDALIATLSPTELSLSDDVLRLMDPDTNGVWFNVPSESFPSKATPIFDMGGVAETAADLTLAAIFGPRRAEPLVQFHASDDAMPSLEEVMDKVERAVMRPNSSNMREDEIARLVRGRYMFALMDLEMADVSQSVKAKARGQLVGFEQRLLAANNLPSNELNHRLWLADQISAHLNREAPAQDLPSKGPKTPPGSPIGSSPVYSVGAYETCWHCED